eukprot:TRINITY_DN2028_c0_g1_i2.p4 TRINITY_DN2028_c0_g1~~TRINITY_DN2028_c0_g1_i2.p4  ORF type:complete len:101 (+),score=39.92 TRINITY_DN2028_c0_g1_i2:710-1012(+)
MQVINVFGFVPFYLIAIAAIAAGWDWIQVPVIVYSSCVLYSVALIVVEEVMGVHRSKDLLLFAAVYGSYAVVPLGLIYRFSAHHPFGGYYRARKSNPKND